MSDDRPIARTRPHPAPDAGADPVDLVPLALVPTPAPATAKQAHPSSGVESTSQAGEGDDDPLAALTGNVAQGSFQLGVRVSSEYYELVHRLHKETGASKRKIVENALEYTYGKRDPRP